MNVAKAFVAATGGRDVVDDDWISATALRPLLQDDPCLAWLRWHSAAYGFEEDTGEYSFLAWISEVAGRFEEEWVRRMAPDAARANERDTDVTKAAAVRRTLDLMARPDICVIAKAALWLAEIKAYGTADLIARASWIRKTFPQLTKCLADTEDHWVVLDAKFMTGLDTSRKRDSLRLASTQVRLYSYILGHLQGVMPTHAFLITRDRVDDPLPVAVEHDGDSPLDSMIADLIAECRHIKCFGHRYTPWTCSIVQPNWRNREDAPWAGAKRRILRDFWPHQPLETLPYVGGVQAEALRKMGYRCVEDLLRAAPDDLNIDSLPRLGVTRARLLRAVLEANRTGKPTPIPAFAVLPKKRIEMYVDFEFLSNCNVDFDGSWPHLTGREMVFTIGIGWEDQSGCWKYRQFVAESETPEAERRMWWDFLRFLRGRGIKAEVSTDTPEAALYHWSPAEWTQARRAAERLGMPELENLPWSDLRAAFIEGAVALPGQWSYGLKTVVEALGVWSPDHRVQYPKGLDEGLSAMVCGWQAYQQANPRATREMDLISRYLETDCRSLWVVLSWMRSKS